MSRRVTVAALLSAALVVLAAAPAAPATPESGAAADAAVSFFDSTQLPSGGWDPSDPTDFSCGFTTVDVALAVAEAGQSGATWSTTEARAAIEAVENGGNDALDYLDDQAEGLCGGPPSVGKSAQLIVLAGAVGADPAAFDPASDGSPVDLVAILDSGLGDGSYGSIYTTPFAAFADIVLGRAVPAETVDFLLAQQRDDGGFETGLGADVDTTALSVAALVAGGVDPADEAITEALGFLAERQEADGGFTFTTPGDGSNANSTGLALVGIAATGYDVNEPCWRGSGAAVDASAYVSPDEFLRGSQLVDGSWAGFSPTFAAAQAAQGLLRSWVPPVVAEPRSCPDEPVVAPTEDEAGTSEVTTLAGEAASDPGGVSAAVATGTAGTTAAPTLPATGPAFPRSGPLALASVGALLLVAGAAAVAVRRRVSSA